MISSIITVFSFVVFIVWIINFMLHWVGLQKIPDLPHVIELLPEEPLVSIIIAAKNEENMISKTMKSIIHQNYSNFELIVVNDRSTDHTGDRAENIAKSAREKKVRVQVIHIDHLPDDWLGKNHALQMGVKKSEGAYVLFTDADVHFYPETIRSAMSFFLSHKLHHLTLAPRMIADGFWLRGFVNYFLFSLSMVKWPWLPNNDRQKKSGYGIGAFNLLSRDVYDKIGQHKAIAMRPDDDLQLGTKIKQAGFKQRFIIGKNHLEVEWYPSLQAAIVGLEKNMFAGLQYSVPLLVVAMLGKALFYFVPFMALFFTKDFTLLAFSISCILIIILHHQYTHRMNGEHSKEAIVLPLFVLLFMYATIRSCMLILIRGGMEWRGTFYSLDQLKQQQKNKN